ncbi:MAG: hypothetical protein HRT40_09880 [Campylobacteraceae bacterium]|nr:hypothetical protein [Campylobacteraceae bacterium]
MVLKVFVYSILFISIFFLMGDVEDKKDKSIVSNEVMLSFKDATMYSLSEEKVNRIVNAQTVLRYKNKDVMHNARILLANEDKNIDDEIKADIMIKKGKNYSFLNNASFKRSDFISLYSDELFYNAKNGIITNTKKYNGIYYSNIIRAKNLYFDSINNDFKSEDVHFEINIKEN